MKIEIIENQQQKKEIVRAILEALPDWFGVPESREQYIAASADEILVAAMENGQALGFLCLKETGKATVELAVMGVLQPFHRHGIGRKLYQKAKEIATAQGYAFMQVKTVKMGCYEDYDRTNLFYQSLGFKELEVFPLLWDEWNPCQVYVMYLGNA